MFDIVLNGAHLLIQGVVMLVSVTIYNSYDVISHYTPEDRDTVVAIEAHPVWWRSDSNCNYLGVMVPFVRDWSETVKHGEFETVIPPEPDVTAGQALIYTKKVCKDKPDQPVFLVDDIQRGHIKLVARREVVADDITTIRPEFQPKWLHQVLDRIQRAAKTDPTAQSAVNDLAAFEANREAQAKAAAVASDAVAASAPVAASTPAAAASEPATPAAAVTLPPTAQTN